MSNKSNGQKALSSLLRGLALENDAMYEARAESVCSMGVGCGIYGVCFSERMGKPEMCGRIDAGDTAGIHTEITPK